LALNFIIVVDEEEDEDEDEHQREDKDDEGDVCGWAILQAGKFVRLPP
jgi:hypothetical protein